MSSDDDGQIDLILDYLYLGGRKGAKNRGLLRQRNIRHIINMTPPRNVDELAGCPNFFEKEKELTYLRCPIFDGISEDIAQFFDRCIAFIQKGRAWGNVLVHCNRGVSRSSSIIVAYLMKRKGLGLKEALEFTKGKRGVVRPNTAFIKQLEEYEQHIKAKSIANAGPISPMLTPRRAPSSQPKGANQGVQLPPHLQHLGNQSTAEDDAAQMQQKSKSLGPQLPPHLQHLANDQSEDGSNDADEAPVADTTNSLGPQLPPHLQHLANNQSEDGGSTVKAPVADTTEPKGSGIGPELPPHLQHLMRPASPEGTEPSPKRAKV